MAAVVDRLVSRALRETLRLSPRPCARMLRRQFAAEGATLAAELAPLDPEGVASTHDERYGEHPDALLDVFRPETAEQGALPTVVWIHGGGWVGGSKDELRTYLRLIAARGYTVVGIRYPLAPEARYPEPVRHAMAALAHLREHANRLRVDPDRLFLAGDSAGAQIAAQVAAMAHDAEYAAAVGVVPAVALAQLRGAALCCGPYDVAHVRDDSPMRWFFTTILWAYSGTRHFRTDPSFATFSVGRYVTHGFPPTFLTAGNADPLVEHSHALAATLRDAGVEVDTLFFPPDHSPPVEHEYQFHLTQEVAREAFERMISFFDRHRDPR